MEMAQVVAIGLVGTVLAVVLRKQSPEMSLFVGVITGIIIFLFLCEKLSFILTLLEQTAVRAGVSDESFAIVLKVIGIAYLAQFGMQLCADAGESAIAQKIELAGKILIMAISAPVLVSLLEVVMGLL